MITGIPINEGSAPFSCCSILYPLADLRAGPAQHALAPTSVSSGYSTSGPLTGALNGKRTVVSRSSGFSLQPYAFSAGPVVIAAAGIRIREKTHGPP